jgi:hypothetical protein
MGRACPKHLVPRRTPAEHAAVESEQSPANPAERNRVIDVDAFIGAAEVYDPKLAEAGCRPAVTLLWVSRLGHPSLLVEVEATAVQ